MSTIVEKSSLRSGAVVVLLSAALSLLVLRSWVFPLDSFPVSGNTIDQDCFQGVWNLWFATESVAAGKSPYHTDSIYYPVGANLAHHSLNLGFFPLAALVRLVTRGDALYPLVAYRLLPLIGFTLLLAGTYAFLRALDLGIWAAAVGAVSYAFSRFHLHHVIHPNYIADFFVPICLAQLVHLYRQPSGRKALAAALLLGVGVYFTEAMVYVDLAVVLLVVLVGLSVQGRSRLRQGLRAIGPAPIASSVAVLFALVAPYATLLLRDHVIEPMADEAVQYSANALGLVVPDPRATPLYGSLFARLAARITAGLDGSQVFLGFVPISLAVVGLAVKPTPLVKGAALLAGTFLVFAMGPELGILDRATSIPLPYSLLAHAPVFEWGRTPVRLLAVGSLFLMVVAGSGLMWIEQRLRHSVGRGAASACGATFLLWALAETHSPPPASARFVPPRELARLAPGPVLDLPPREKDGYAALLQTLHRHPIGTGYTARISPARLSHIRALRRSFDKGGPDFWRQVGMLGFRNVIVSPDSIGVPASLAPLGEPPPGIRVIDLRRRSDLGGPDCDGAPTALPEHRASFIAFGGGDRDPALCYGWGEPEGGASWSVRGQAAIVFAADPGSEGVLRFLAEPFLVPGRCEAQRVSVELGGRQVGQWLLVEPGMRELGCTLPQGSLQRSNTLVFRLPDAESPLALHAGTDRRTLAIRVAWLRVMQGGSR